MKQEIEVIDRLDYSDEWLKTAIEKALELLSDEEIEKINKIIIAPNKAGGIVNFVIKK
ncbi:hypothetical protein LCGC14_0794080 [marine sediment metagenome]|uniref:Uncharacterized protein n=1 Tax=marine sediment metagenome TaxID=412755 RepID=A0A0F9PRM6_9ZZZZ